VNDTDDDFEPQFAVVPEGETLVLDDLHAAEDSHARRAAIGIAAGLFNKMILLPRAEATPLLRVIHAETLPFGGYFGYYKGVEVEMHRLDILTATCDRYWPDVTDFLYGPAGILEPALAQAGIELAPLPTDFMDPFERGLARYAIYGS